MKTENQPPHTQGKWIIINNHPILDTPTIVVNSGFNESKKVETYKVICEFRDWRGDTFTALEDGEAEANARLIMDAITTLEQNKKKLELFEEMKELLVFIHYLSKNAGGVLLREKVGSAQNIENLLKKAQEL